MELTLPVIVLSGAALYDGKTKTYAHLTPLDRDAAEKVLSVLDEHGRTPFVYTVIHEVLHIFHGDFTAAEEEAFYHSQRTLAHQSSVYGSPPKNAPPLCIVTLDTRENTCLLYTSKISIVLTDHGPGIPDVELAMKEGWSTAPDHVRSLGFGAGMGLPNIKKYTDEMRIETEIGKGTKVFMVILVQ